MKASISIPSVVLSLLLCTAAWAQDENAAEAAAAEIIEETGAELVDPADSGEALVQPVIDEADEDTADSGEGDAPDESAASAGDDSPDSAPEATEPESAESTESAEAAESESAEAAEPEFTETAAQTGLDAPAETVEQISEAPPSSDIFVFQGHPIFAPEQAELVYRPLVKYLNDALPYRFELEIAPDFHRYWLSTRRGEHPHLVLEEPHLTSFRIERHGFTPLVRAAEPLSYSLLTTVAAASGDSSVRDFIARPVSTMPAPSLGYLILASWFDNPMQQPIIQSSASSWLDTVEIVFSNEADAAMVPNNLVERYVNMENVLTSREFPGLTVAASPAVPIDIQEEIRDALLILHEDEGHYAVLHELDIDRFESARRSDYLGLDSWLGLVYSNY